MSNAFEVDGNLDSIAEVDGVEYFAEYDESWGGASFEELGIDPLVGTEAKPGSEQKVQMLAARYAAGLPLWHDEDCYDHGPAGEFVEEDEYDDD